MKVTPELSLPRDTNPKIIRFIVENISLCYIATQECPLHERELEPSNNTMDLVIVPNFDECDTHSDDKPDHYFCCRCSETFKESPVNHVEQHHKEDI